ncbi:threonine ammonia-lyase, biosynthetic [Pseudomonadales bacterium]|jgi:threonine dehydratase|nr:threonine ammonia-lyase, biosynthetic [Gammaproteobacteria bacterium]MDB2450114.1 threonine ammonia-lyase, biosynthetic [Pseudomonadales bacterium]MBT3736415.1 threonine ammonia-lyase, biosynthetic [Gammaproteobacteria bacterium]MBT7538863.1 threonine ammonia-lyase, biosynthetic [Gammaproteobacteria bacterium]MDB3989300.1 threonine ammonia-lyase, biosynthetic [Pseudomonadales bacterium]
MQNKYIKKILEADVYDVAIQSPMEQAQVLSERLESEVFLKREDLQPVFSFKLRGAYNKIRQLDAASRKRGVITASAGNHAQGVAMAAQKLNTRAVIVMGKNTPSIKVEAVRRWGARVILFGESYDQAAAHAAALCEDRGYTYVHPFDDPEVIAGQGTIGMEILRQHTGGIDAIFLPVGGGGLICGVGTYIKYLRPEVKIIGVESEGAASMWAALDAGKRVKLDPDELDQFADGTATLQVGKENFKLAKDCVDEVIRVNTDEICAAIKDIFEDTRTISEPSGALSIAGMKKYLERADEPKGQRCVAVVSGANVNFDRLRHISERTEIGERREILLCVTIPEQPGSFRKFCHAIGKRAITEFNYRYADKNSAQVLVGVQTNADYADKKALLEKLGRKYSFIDLSENEVAVLHIRHMVGGRSIGLNNERLFRFEFPERPGALLRFLTGIGSRHNISMFHYRNHGSAWARVLVGVQAADDEMMSLRRELRDIGYRFWEETDNPAYRLLLS